jgi:hypothetical protein
MQIMEGVSKMISTRVSWRIVVFLSLWGTVAAWGRESKPENKSNQYKEENKRVRTIYPKKTQLDFEGTQIEGELRNPGDFYFQHRPEEKFDSLVKRRKNFHREMMRDVVFSK